MSFGHDRTDRYEWAKKNNIFMEQDELVRLLRTSPETTLVVDVRDEDHVGGNVAGSLHCADSAFDIAAVRKAAEGKTVVVFHCMESVMRGPRCARRLLDSSQGETLPFAVRVLRGGADRWIRRFYRDPTLVSNFDKDYWGFLTHGEATESVHKEYSRPDNFHLDM